MRTAIEQFRDTIRVIPDFPKKGILFRDITPVLAKPTLCADVLDELSARWDGIQIDVIAGIESRGFLFGMSLAGKLGVPFIPLRKVGKLPGDTYKSEYQLEYGSAILEMQKDAIHKGQRVLIHDDLLATAGTANAAAHLIEQAGGEVVGFSFLIELEYFNGSQLLSKHGVKVDSLTSF
jgi:adenine phosphoribosyltransferase